jgi:hypothetical protein
MAELGDPVQMVDDLAREALRRLNAVLGDEIENLVEIRVGRLVTIRSFGVIGFLPGR